MIAIGYGKPGIEKHHADSHHQWHDPYPLYVSKSWWYVSLDRWMDIQNHQSFEFPKDISCTSLIEFEQKHPLIYARLQQLIKRAGNGTVWQQNGLAPNLKDYIRFCSVLGQPGLENWSFADRYIRKPYYDLLAIVLNWCNRPITYLPRF